MQSRDFLGICIINEIKNIHFARLPATNDLPHLVLFLFLFIFDFILHFSIHSLLVAPRDYSCLFACCTYVCLPAYIQQMAIIINSAREAQHPLCKFSRTCLRRINLLGEGENVSRNANVDVIQSMSVTLSDICVCFFFVFGEAEQQQQQQ